MSGKVENSVFRRSLPHNWCFPCRTITLGFDRLELFFNIPERGTVTPKMKTLVYAPQKVADQVRRADTPEHSTLLLTASPMGTYGAVVWEKKNAQFAEKDEETGWSHFQLREYDPVVGRWTAGDPFRQHWSPYVGMGNNPVSSIDTNGGWSKRGAWWRSGFGLFGSLTESGKDGGREVWGYVNADGHHFGDDARNWVRGIDWAASDRLLARAGYWDDNYNSFVTGNGIEPFYLGTDFNDIVDGAAAISQGYYVDGSMALASAALPWISWKSVKFFGHAFTRHGQGDKITKKLIV